MRVSHDRKVLLWSSWHKIILNLIHLLLETSLEWHMFLRWPRLEWTFMTFWPFDPLYNWNNLLLCLLQLLKDLTVFSEFMVQTRMEFYGVKLEWVLRWDWDEIWSLGHRGGKSINKCNQTTSKLLLEKTNDNSFWFTTGN